MNTGTKAAVAALIVGMAILPAASLAGTPIDESKPAKADGIVTIENMNGPVTVVGWTKNEVKVMGTLGDGPERLDFDVDGRRTTIEVVWPERGDDDWGRGKRNPEETVLEVSVPKGSEVRVEGVNSNLDLSGVDGSVELETVNGDITISGSPEDVEAGTVNGSIDVDATSEAIKVETVNGELRITAGRGEISGASVNGDITITGDLAQRGEFSSVTGDIEFEGGLTGRGPFEFSSHSGSIVLSLSRKTSARFEIDTFSGRIENDFGPKAERTSKYGPGMELSFTAGDGDSRVEISSFSGNIEIRTD